MNETVWAWAPLDDRGLALIQEAERTLGADTGYILAYRAGQPGRDAPARVALPPAMLNASQVECLRGVETRVGAVAVAYRRDAGAP